MTEIAPAPEEHSKIVGGSNAGQRLACPRSYKLELKVPEKVRKKSSVFADKGTALHAAMAHILNNDILDASEVLGMEFGGGDSRASFVMEDADIVTLQECIDYFDALVARMEGEPGAGEVQWMIETRVEMPGIPDSFGTMDLLLWSNVRTVGLDWKFGAGKRVLAVYPDDENGDLLNPQGLYYLRASAHTHPHAFQSAPMTDTVHPCEFHIVQPLAQVSGDEEPHTMADDITMKELEEFRMALIRAVAEAMSDDARMARGPHCDFKVCKTVCPLHHGAVLDLTKLKGGLTERKDTPLGDVWDYGEALAAALEMREIAEPFFAEVEKQAHTFMESGMDVPGWKLVDKRATRKWRNEATTIDTLRAAKIPDNVIMVTEVRSPAQVEAAMKAAKIKGKLPQVEIDGQLEDLFVKVSSGTTIAPDADRRQAVVSEGERTKRFAAAMKSLLPAPAGKR